MIEANKYITAAAIAERINMNIRSVQRILASLKNKHLIERIGGTRGYWEITIDEQKHNNNLKI